VRRRMAAPVFCVMALGLAFLAAGDAPAAPPLPRISIGASPASGPQDVAVTLQILFLLTVLTLAPAILLLMTPFTRIVIVLAFLRQALGTQQIPPNQVLIGLALFMTFFLMRPIGAEVYKDSLQPYMAGKMGYELALKKALVPVRRFMFSQTRERDLGLFVRLSKSKRPANRDEVDTLVLVPAFVISELKTAFTMGFLLFIPFLVIDMVVASTLMAMGMLMLPPVMISLPFKLLLFIMVDGWNLIAKSLAASFGGMGG
jgi:flagellar biosynthesis protein FliP